MKKTYKEKYLELKKENNFLKKFNKRLLEDLGDCKLQFLHFKHDLKVKEDKEYRNSLIFTFIVITLLFIFATISLFVG